ncbi:MAG: histidinol-phosphatase HisJ family protein [Anaerostipes sp.]|uniref:histidinol-phosphatase HisJ family protein n=1 Tax=Anaerostipes sp. TaxID=1872530 RepID=UPI0039937D26
MIRADYHLHTNFSSDSETPMESMILEGIRRGLKTICFTEHHDIDYPDNPDHLDFLLDLPSYKETLFHLKEKYKHQIEVCFGIELGLMPHTLTQCQEFARREEFDFIIGSTHIVDSVDPYETCYFETYPLKQGLQKYFEHILKNVSSFYDYCVYGHLDYAARYIKDKSFQFSYKDYCDLLDEILKKIIENGKGIEVNTAGLKYGMSDPNPHHEILQRYLELGGEILTIGSDGHCPEHMAYDFQKIPDFLKDLGFKYYTIFREKKPCFEKL